MIHRQPGSIIMYNIFYGSAPSAARHWGLSAFRLLALPLLALIILKLISPIGYVGGGSDDWHYLQAARCTAEHGLCLPQSHWWVRFPLVAPMGLSLALLGETRFAILLVPLIYAIAAIILFTLNVARAFGRLPAIVAGCVLVATPVFTKSILQPNVDLVEFTWLMAAILALQSAVSRNSQGLALIAGMFLAITIMSRPSALAILPILTLGFVIAPAEVRKLALPVGIGIAALLSLETVLYWTTTGNPLFGWMLSLHHTRIPSSELATSVDTLKSPLFNPAYIAGWKPSMGIHVHWTIDPVLNILANPQIGGTLMIGIILTAANYKAVGRGEYGGRMPLYLAGAATLYFAILTYGLAIDPKPRMFVPVVAAAAILVGLSSVSLWKARNRLIIGLFMTILAFRSLIYAFETADLRKPEALARQWAISEPSGLAILDMPHRLMTQSPEIRRLPTYPASDARSVIALGVDSCTFLAGDFSPGAWQLARAVPFPKQDSAPVAWLRNHRILFGEADTAVLCLFRRKP